LKNVAKFQENLTFSSLRSSQVTDLGVNEKPICNFLLVVIVSFAVSATVFEIFTLKDRKLLIIPRKRKSWGYQTVKKS